MRQTGIPAQQMVRTEPDDFWLPDSVQYSCLQREVCSKSAAPSRVKSAGFTGSSVNTRPALGTLPAFTVPLNFRRRTVVSDTLTSVRTAAVSFGFSKFFHGYCSSWSAIVNFCTEMRQRGLRWMNSLIACMAKMLRKAPIQNPVWKARRSHRIQYPAGSYF